LPRSGRPARAAAAEDYAAGVANTDKDPTALAIAAGPRLLRNFTEAFKSGKWANGLRRSARPAGRRRSPRRADELLDRRAGREGEGRRRRSGRCSRSSSRSQTARAAMPNVTDGDREQRMLTWVRGMRTFNKS
jgi:hypothetical protein